MKLKGQVAIVTGSAQGIGQAIATALSQEGARLVISDIREEAATAAAKELAAAGQETMAVAANVADDASVKAMVEKVLSSWGKIDILVNNAGITRDALLIRMKEADWDAVLDINLKGVFHCTKAVLPGMTKQRSGKIVNIASIVGVMGNAGQANYVASKAAVIGLTKTTAREYASRGIAVNAVAPGFIQTAMTDALSQDVRQRLMEQIPLGRLGTPQDVANAVLFLVSEQAAYITGQVLHVNGGMLMV
jgi:3-oxoacyl-[acyl-carrier protein] reductase